MALWHRNEWLGTYSHGTGDLHLLIVKLPDGSTRWGWLRLHPPKHEASGLTITYMVDPDGTLLRLIQN